MKIELIVSLLAQLLKLLKPEHVTSIIDTVLDKIENKVTASEPKWDDALILPLCKLIRDALNIKDND